MDQKQKQKQKQKQRQRQSRGRNPSQVGVLRQARRDPTCCCTDSTQPPPPPDQTTRRINRVSIARRSRSRKHAPAAPVCGACVRGSTSNVCICRCGASGALTNPPVAPSPAWAAEPRREWARRGGSRSRRLSLTSGVREDVSFGLMGYLLGAQGGVHWSARPASPREPWVPGEKRGRHGLRECSVEGGDKVLEFRGTAGRHAAWDRVGRGAAKHAGGPGSPGRELSATC
ncbi:hypothetical protein P171DRAFT_234513 [Karstenula rhodostoma CBS 690.94]|uniref:Uncharacterized protein n=1 Tax=Karstenula rhodostoma CBS 690.94 TaxID=1392251 RepID=A0A9P4UDK0_9PLEO|nr:hypothetical protein P171DRAFT_234513 [Karstenula rhodostoma CBS 690.94]